MGTGMTISRIALPALLLVAGCNALPFGGAPEVAGREFLSTSVTVGGVDRPLVGETRIRIGFGEDDISASAGCNSFGATYRIDGGVLAISDGATTEMGCELALMNQDTWLFAFLGAQPTVALAGDELVLEEGDAVIALLDRDVADPDLPLIGPTWTVTSVIDGGGVKTVPEGVVATLAFTEEGLVLVSTGCNSGSGAYQVVSDTIRFGGIALTEMACEGAAGEMESAVLMVLEADVVRYEIDAQSMTLSIGDHGLQLAGNPSPTPSPD